MLIEVANYGEWYFITVQLESNYFTVDCLFSSFILEKF